MTAEKPECNYKVSFRITEDGHDQLTCLALEQGKTLDALIVDALALYVVTSTLANEKPGGAFGYYVSDEEWYQVATAIPGVAEDEAEPEPGK